MPKKTVITAVESSTENASVGTAFVAPITKNKLEENLTKDITAVAERTPIETVLRKHGLGLDDFVVALKEGLSASKDLKDRYGDLIETIPDHNTRHKFFASGMELLGYIKSSAGVNVNIVNISKEERELIDAYKRA